VAETTAVFERLVAEHRAGTAAVHVRQVSAGTVIDVKRTNPAFANFGVLADDFERYTFDIGQSQRGFPWERRYRKGEWTFPSKTMRRGARNFFRYQNP
jgi:hypothetical protein